MNLEKLKKSQHWSYTNTSASLSFRSEPETMSLLASFCLIAVSCHYCLKETSVPMK